MAQQLSELVQSQPERYGSREWLVLYRALIGRVLQSGPTGALTEPQIQTILVGGTLA